MAADQQLDEKAIQLEQLKIKKLSNKLKDARGSGTSMITLVIRPKDDIFRINKMLVDEAGTASNIKSRVNRLSVLSAITSAQQKLKTYNRTPPNGLFMFSGTIITEDGKEKKISIAFEPFKPTTTSLYMCDNKFHTQALSELLESNDRFGFIVMDGNGSLFGALQGSSKEILYQFTVDLPKKHGRGGQSSVRFARLRLEKRHNYVRRVGEIATKLFITNDKPNVTGLIIAGSADFKSELATGELLDQRLRNLVLKIVDVSYGGENGFSQAIDLSRECLNNIKIVNEKKVIGAFFDEIAQDTNKYVYGIDQTITALEMGCVETLILYDNLEAERVVYGKNGKEIVRYFAGNSFPEEIENLDTNEMFPVIEHEPLCDWLIDNYSCYGCEIECVTDSSAEGSQFVKGFGGIGGILRYKIDIEPPKVYNDDDYESDFM